MKKKRGSKKHGINLNPASPSVDSRRFSDFFPSFFLKEWRILLVSFSTFLLLIALYFAAMDLYQTLLLQQKVQAEKQHARAQIASWKLFLQTHPQYRDGYFKIAVLSYQLRQQSIALTYVKKALEIDPNFTIGKEFGKKLME